MAFFHRLLVSWGFISFSSSCITRSHRFPAEMEEEKGERERERGEIRREIVSFLFSIAFYPITRVRSINDRVESIVENN